MDRMQLLELVANGENARVAFMRDDCRPEDITAAMAALLNLGGGVILLGVENDGQISGLTRSRGTAEEWVMNVARQHLQPAITPIWTCMEIDDGKDAGVIELDTAGPGKPYKAKLGGRWIAFTRVGSTSRQSTREEEGRLYQAGGLLRYEIKAVLDAGPEFFDVDRVENYFQDVLERSVPPWEDSEYWWPLLLDVGLLVPAGDDVRASVAGLLLFGENPNRRLPQAGVTAAAFPGSEKDYNTIDEEWIRGPLTPRVSRRGTVVETGVIDRAVEFVKRNMGSVAWLEGARRLRKTSFPADAVREAIVNAVTHRDYMYEGTYIEISLYCDRMEVVSPGRLPNGMTVEKMRNGGASVARNKLLREILRDYGYGAHSGTGVRNRIIESMRYHNGTEPDLVEDDHRFVVRLWKQQPHGRRTYSS